VSIRLWDDDVLERDEFDRVPASWTYYVSAKTADEARMTALSRFPHGATSHVVFDNSDDARIDREEVSRISVDVQRVGIPQDAKEGAAFHLTERLGELAGYLDHTFPAAVVAHVGASTVVGITMNAESHDEAEADVNDALAAFGRAIGLDEEFFVGACSTGQGGLDADDLAIEIWAYHKQ
jgi:hypothetical protein